MADPKTVQIRDVDPKVWADMKAEAAKRQVPMRDLVFALWRYWLDATD